MATYTNDFDSTDAQGRYRRCGTVAMSTSYSTGGEAITASSFGVAAIDTPPKLQTVGGYVPEWDESNGKVKVRHMSDGDEITSGANISSLDFPCEVCGDPTE